MTALQKRIYIDYTKRQNKKYVKKITQERKKEIKYEAYARRCK